MADDEDEKGRRFTMSDVHERAALAKRWLRAALRPDMPNTFRMPMPGLFELRENDPLTRALMRLWVESTKAVDLDTLARHVERVEGGADEQLTAWLSRAAVRAVYLVRELRDQGVML